MYICIYIYSLTIYHTAFSSNALLYNMCSASLECIVPHTFLTVLQDTRMYCLNPTPLRVPYTRWLCVVVHSADTQPCVLAAVLLLLLPLPHEPGGRAAEICRQRVLWRLVVRTDLSSPSIQSHFLYATVCFSYTLCFCLLLTNLLWYHYKSFFYCPKPSVYSSSSISFAPPFNPTSYMPLCSFTTYSI